MRPRHGDVQSGYADLLLHGDMAPGNLFLELISLVALIASFLSLAVASMCLPVGLFQIRENLGLALEHLRGLADVLHASLVFFAKLTELSALQEELESVQRALYFIYEGLLPCTCQQEKMLREIAWSRNKRPSAH